MVLLLARTKAGAGGVIFRCTLPYADLVLTFRCAQASVISGSYVGTLQR